jgi:hypothetical protein
LSAGRQSLSGIVHLAVMFCFLTRRRAIDQSQIGSYFFAIFVADVIQTVPDRMNLALEFDSDDRLHTYYTFLQVYH